MKRIMAAGLLVLAALSLAVPAIQRLWPDAAPARISAIRYLVPQEGLHPGSRVTLQLTVDAPADAQLLPVSDWNLPQGLGPTATAARCRSPWLSLRRRQLELSFDFTCLRSGTSEPWTLLLQYARPGMAKAEIQAQAPALEVIPWELASPEVQMLPAPTLPIPPRLQLHPAATVLTLVLASLVASLLAELLLRLSRPRRLSALEQARQRLIKACQAPLDLQEIKQSLRLWLSLRLDIPLQDCSDHEIAPLLSSHHHLVAPSLILPFFQSHAERLFQGRLEPGVNSQLAQDARRLLEHLQEMD